MGSVKEHMSTFGHPWPKEADVLLLPEGSSLDGGSPLDRSRFTAEQTDLRKYLRTNGFVVATSPELREELVRKSDDLWLGVVAFGADVLANGAGSMLASYVQARLGVARLARTRVHAKLVAIETDELTYRSMEVDGLPAEQFLKAFDRFCEGPSDGDPD